MELPASGEYLLIDLSHKQCENREIPAEALQDYPCGTALATFLLSLHQPPGIDPLAAESVIVISRALPFPVRPPLRWPANHLLAGVGPGGLWAASLRGL